MTEPVGTSVRHHIHVSIDANEGRLSASNRKISLKSERIYPITCTTSLTWQQNHDGDEIRVQWIRCTHNFEERHFMMHSGMTEFNAANTTARFTPQARQPELKG